DGTVASTTFNVAGNYSAKIKGGVLTVAFGFSQQTMSNVPTSRELSFRGELTHQGGSTFVWQFATGSGSTSIGIGADQIRLGTVTAQTQLKVTMKDGKTQSVDAILGFSF